MRKPRDAFYKSEKLRKNSDCFPLAGLQVILVKRSNHSDKENQPS